jgi:hypothetical protein
LPLPSVYLRDRDIEQSNTNDDTNNNNYNTTRADEASFLKLALA